MDEFTLSQFQPSDGIGECEEIIKEAGGTISNGVIMLTKKQDIELVLKAADYLCNEWDYALSWEKES